VNSAGYLLSFIVLSGEFDPAYDLKTPALLNAGEVQRLGWFTDRLSEVKAAMELADANGQVTNNVAASSDGGGQHLYFRVIELYQDSDGDGLLDHHESGVTGSDPWDADSDNDGFNDAVEFSAGSDPLDSNSTPTTITVDPEGGKPLLEDELDEDEDTVPNGVDADPLDFYVDWERSALPEFLVLPIPASSGLIPVGVNNKGKVVLNGVGPDGRDVAYHWQPGMEEPELLKLGADAETPLTLDVDLFQSLNENNEPVTEEVSFKLKGARVADINDQGMIIGTGTYVDDSGSPYYGDQVAIALKWGDAEAVPVRGHPGKVAIGEWGELLLASYPKWINETGTVVGHAGYAVSESLFVPPYTSRLVPNLWEGGMGGVGESLYDPASSPSAVPYFSSLHREKTALTGADVATVAAGYWEKWQMKPDEVFRDAGGNTVAVATVPNDREVIAGDSRLMLFSKEDRWEPALRMYQSGYHLTEDGTVWSYDMGVPVLWYPLEKEPLVELLSDPSYDNLQVKDVTNHGVATLETSNGNAILLPVEFNVFPPEPTEEEIDAAGEADWEIRSFQISADEPSIYVQVFFQLHGVNADGEVELLPVEDGSVIKWEIDYASEEGATLDETESTTEGGLASVLLTVPPTQKGLFKVKATTTKLIAKFDGSSSDPVVIENTAGLIKAKSQTIEVVPGVPASIVVTAEREDGPASSLPADGKSEMQLKAVITDQHGNPAARGTRVYWHLKGSGGIIDAQEILAQEDGSVTASLVAGNVTGTQTITIEAEGFEHQETIQNVPVVFTQFTASPSSLDMASGTTATITAVFQDVADGADIRWSTSKGRLLDTDDTVQGGSATALLEATETTTGDAVVVATVGGTSRAVRVSFTTSAPIEIAVERPVLAGDATTDGTEAVPSLIGPDEQVAYYTSTPVTVSAPGHAGQWVTLSASGSNPELQFPFDHALVDGESFDASGLVAAEFSGASVALSPSPVHEGGGAAVFSGGSDHVSIPDSGSLQPDPGFDLALWLRPNELGGDILSKSGQYTLSLDAQGHLVFSFGVGASAVSVTSTKTLSTGVWSFVKIERQAARICLTVNQNTTTAPAPQTTPTGTAPLFIGTGFEGRIDTVAINSTGGVPGAAVVQFVDGNQKQLNAEGQAEFTIKATGQVPETPGGESVDITAQVGTTLVKAKDAVQVVPKRDLAVVLAIAGHSSFIGSSGQTTFTEKDIDESVASLCRAKMRSQQHLSGIPKTLSGSAGEKAEVGYRIAIMMEEYSDEAGDIHPLMKISAESGAAGASQPLPPEVAEVLNLQWMEVMTEAAERPTDQTFNDFIHTRYGELVAGLNLLSVGDINGFMQLAGALDGDESFEDTAHVGEQLGKETLDKWAREVGDVAIVGGALQKSLHWINNDMRDTVRESRDDLVAKIGSWSTESEDFLRKATIFLQDQGFIDEETASGIGFVSGALEQAEELIAAGLTVDEVASMLAQIRALIVDAIAADDPAAQQEARDQLKLLASQPLAQVSEIPAHAAQFQEEVATYWNQGNHFDAGRSSAAALGVAFVAKDLKKMLLKSGERVMRKARTYSTGKREAYIRKNNQHWVTEIGKRGESWAFKRLKKKLKAVDIFPIQQTENGHGIDLVVVTKDRRIVFVEVKGSAGGTVGKPRLKGPARELGMRRFTSDRIDQAIGDSKPMTGVSQQTIDRATAIKEMLKDSKIPVSGLAIQVDWALSWFPRGRAYDWEDGVGDLVPGLP
jgi:hypothetical protein